MKYPDFFNKIEKIKLKDELSNFLGTFEDGLVEFSYLDIVKSAGHSCPTVAGVISNVITQITGATEISGFKGINGNFQRTGLMKFNDNITSSVKFQRLDTGAIVQVIYNPNLILANPKTNELMQKMMKNIATKEEKKEFGNLWQKRVEEIFNNIEKVIKVL